MNGELGIHSQGSARPDHKEIQRTVINCGDGEWPTMVRSLSKMSRNRIHGNGNHGIIKMEWRDGDWLPKSIAGDQSPLPFIPTFGMDWIDFVNHCHCKTNNIYISHCMIAKNKNDSFPKSELKWFRWGRKMPVLPNESTNQSFDYLIH